MHLQYSTIIDAVGLVVGRWSLVVGRIHSGVRGDIRGVRVQSLFMYALLSRAEVSSVSHRGGGDDIAFYRRCTVQYSRPVERAGCCRLTDT